MALVDELIARFNHLANERYTWESHWQEIADYVLPRKAEITVKRTPGEKRTRNLYDTTAIRANQILAAGLHGYLTSPGTPWFTLRLQDVDLMESRDVKLWLKDTERKIRAALNFSNFNSQIHELYLDLGAFGTACMYEEEDPARMVRFDTRPIAEIYIAENALGIVDTVFRKFEMTARQAYQRWGDKVSEPIKKALEKNKPDEKFEFVHAVFPREDYHPRKADAKNMPWASVYVELSTKHLISEGGYHEFPYFVPRWLKSSSEVYGRSPAMTALPDIKMVNEMARTIIKAAQKVVDPPVVLPHDGFLLPLKLTPGGINYRTSPNPNDRVEPLITGADIPVGLNYKETRRQAIREAFFVDLFLLLAQRKAEMTATEVLERVEEKMVILGPTLGRLMAELLNPIITRTFNILSRRGVIAPPPPELEGQEYIIEYVSPLARAQRAAEVGAINRLFLTVLPLIQLQPTVLDNIDGDRVVKHVADAIGAPPEILRSDREVQQMRQERINQLQQQQLAEGIERAVNVAKEASQIKGIEEIAG